MAAQSFYLGDGSNRIFTIGFPYSNLSEVKVKVGDLEVPFTFISNTQIQTATAPVPSSRVRVYRVTSFNNPEVRFEDGAVLTEDDLNENTNQLFRKTEEIIDDITALRTEAIRAPDGSGLTIGPVSQRAGKVLGFDTNGQFQARSPEDFRGLKGDPGAGAGYPIGTLADAAGQTIPTGTDAVFITGQTTRGDFRAGLLLIYDPAVNAAYVASHPGEAFVDLAGRGFRLARTPANSMAFLASGVGSATRALEAKLQEQPSVLDKGADPTGTVPSSDAIQKAIDQYNYVWVPDGIYLIDKPIILRANTTIEFSGNAIFRPSKNGITIFDTVRGTFTPFSQVLYPRIEGNGKTGITAFYLDGFRHRAAIQFPMITGVEVGIVLARLNWDTTISHPWIWQTKYPIQALNGSNAVDIHAPRIEGYYDAAHPELAVTEVGIYIKGGPDYDTTSVRVHGGYIQGALVGVKDEGAFGTIIDGTYFERNRDGDVVLQGSFHPNVMRTQHYVSQGYSAIKGRGVDGATIFDPLMSNGGRSIGLYDFDSSNINSFAYDVSTAGGVNLPRGNTEGLGVLPKESSGTWLPVIAGSGSPGSATYGVQKGRWTRTGRRVLLEFDLHWSGHTGTGNITLIGAPTTLTPQAFDLTRQGTVRALSIPISGQEPHVVLNGAGANMTLLQLAVDGTGKRSQALVPIVAEGSLYGTIEYTL